MPLRDLFHGQVSRVVGWESFPSMWISNLVRHLNQRLLSARYRALPMVHLGSQVEVDVATVEEEHRPAPPTDGNGAATAVWAPAQPAQTFPVDLAAHDVFELRIEDRGRGRRLVAAVELVSPRNKDRPSARRDFAMKCASYLQQCVSVVIVDIVTDRHHDLYAELLRQVGLPARPENPETPRLYAVACRCTKVEDRWQLETWPEELALGAALPRMPLWLADDLAVPLELESSYEETARDLRVGS